MQNILNFGKYSIKFKSSISHDSGNKYTEFELLFRDDLIDDSWSLSEIIELGSLQEHFNYYNSSEFALHSFPQKFLIVIDCIDTIIFKVMYTDKVLKIFDDLDEAIEYIVGE